MFELILASILEASVLIGVVILLVLIEISIVHAALSYFHKGFVYRRLILR